MRTGESGGGGGWGEGGDGGKMWGLEGLGWDMGQRKRGGGRGKGDEDRGDGDGEMKMIEGQLTLKLQVVAKGSKYTTGYGCANTR